MDTPMLFCIGSVIVFITIAIKIKKVMSRGQMWTCMLFSAIYQQSVDIWFDEKWNMYGYFYEGIDPQYGLVLFGMFPAITVIFLNWYPWTKSNAARFWYIIAWSVFSVAYEWLAVQAGFFYHNTWKYMYEVIDPILFYILILHHRFAVWLYKGTLPGHTK